MQFYKMCICIRYKKNSNGFFCLFFIVLFFSSSLQAQSAEKPADFQFEILCFQTQKFSADSARADIYIAVPYSWLLFLNAGEKYVADYEVSLTVSEKNDNSVIRTTMQPIT